MKKSRNQRQKRRETKFVKAVTKGGKIKFLFSFLFFSFFFALVELDKLKFPLHRKRKKMYSLRKVFLEFLGNILATFCPYFSYFKETFAN